MMTAQQGRMNKAGMRFARPVHLRHDFDSAVLHSPQHVEKHFIETLNTAPEAKEHLLCQLYCVWLQNKGGSTLFGVGPTFILCI